MIKSKTIQSENISKSVQSNRIAPEDTQSVVPSCISAYTLEKPLGSGTQGKVFLARRNLDGLEVAIKRLNIESVKTWKTYELFEREAKVLKSLDIDGIATFYDAFDDLEADSPCAYIVQEYIRGETLASLIKAGHRFSIDRVYDIIIQLLDILKQLHKHTPPIVHRDIKPSNIILHPLEGDNFKVYLIDFGAVANPQLQSGGSTVAGTIGFMPPEQLMGKPVPQSDIYALAAVAVNLITGKSPQDMPVRDFHLIFEPDMQFMPVQVVNTLRHMLEPDVEKRLSNPELLIDAFTKFKQGNYDSLHADQEEISSSDFLKQVKEVHSYAQPGNIDLWQRLPDERPLYYPYNDRDIQPSDETEEPLCFGTKSNIYQKQYNINFRDIDNKYKLHTKEEGVIGIGDRLLGIFLSFSMIIWIAIPLFFIHVGIKFHLILIFVGAIPAFGLPYYLLSVIKKRKAKRATLVREFFTNPRSNESDNDLFYTIQKKGCKTIATIVSVQYINVSDNVCEQNIYTSQIAVHQRPEFKVKYKFNPPNDSDPNDLVHTIIVREPPESFLKVGDPLPILYYIKSDGVDEHVYSIPFPIVLSDVGKFGEILGQSTRAVGPLSYITYHQPPKIRMNRVPNQDGTGDMITYTSED